jgi:uncharacterized membrane protein YdbT with pleckstrin-like domain
MVQTRIERIIRLNSSCDYRTGQVPYGAAMGYIETVLDQNERVLHRGRLHWFIYAPGLGLLVAGVGAMAVAAKIGPEQVVLFGFLMMIVVAPVLLAAWIARMTTEIAVTSQRIIIKRGLIRRSTLEMNAGQIESVYVEQSIAGRLLGFGTVIIYGTGSGIEPIANVAAPLAFRKAVGIISKPPERSVNRH